MIWLPTLCTGLNDDIGSWKISAISAAADRPHLRAVRLELRQVDGPARPAVRAGRRNRDLPSTIRPGRSTILRIDRAVTLFPHPLSPTTPSVAPALMSKLTPSTARTVPSSCAKYVAIPH